MEPELTGEAQEELVVGEKEQMRNFCQWPEKCAVTCTSQNTSTKSVLLIRYKQFKLELRVFWKKQVGDQCVGDGITY